MSIRKTLLVAFVSVGLISAALLASLAFIQARQALQAEIERSLDVQAKVVSAEVDKMMFERQQNALTWSKLDIMQDMQVLDVDKRLSQFLADLRSGYGDVYLQLSAVDLDGRVVSSSSAAKVGTRVADLPAISVPLVRSAASSVMLAFADVNRSSRAEMAAPVPASFREGTLGTLRLELDWSRVADALDQAAGGEGRMVAVLDVEGRLIAASAGLRQRGLLMGAALAGWRHPSSAVVIRRGGSALGSTDMIVGAAESRGYAGMSSLGWTTLVIQPVDMAFAAIHRVSLVFLGLFGLILVATVLTAIWVSRRLAAPIVGLTGFVRGYAHDKILGEPPKAGAGEVGELTEAFVAMVRDVARSQQQLVRASKLAAVGEMSAVIAHEVRTPLGILRSSAQMLLREKQVSPQGRELLGFIESETERLNRLISAMLDTARPRAARYSEVDMHELIHECVAMLSGQARSRGVAVGERPASMRPVIRCDKEQMTQVLLNILMNGLQVLPAGGRIDVSTDDENDGDGGRLRIDVADDGPGIAAADRERIFEAFFFQREGGIGLGLAIVQQIVAAHGGEIEATQSPLGGALFSIRLPRSTEGAAA